MKNKKNRVLAMLLCLCMIMTLLPTTAFATNNKSPDSGVAIAAETNKTSNSSVNNLTGTDAEEESDVKSTAEEAGSELSDEQDNPSKKEEVSTSDGQPSSYGTDVTSNEPAENIKTDEENDVAQIGSTKYDTLKAAIEAANSGSTIELLKDITLDETEPIAVNKSVTITSAAGHTYQIKRSNECNGYMLNLTTSSIIILKNIVVDGGSTDNINATRAMIAVNDNAKLVLNDGAVLTNNNNTEPKGAGGALCVINGSAEMKNGAKITGNKAAGGGGVALVETGTLTMNGGEITGNTAVDYSKGYETEKNGHNGRGGAIYVSGHKNDTDYGEKFTMNGGAISENSSDNDGGAIYAWGYTIVTINDGEISENICKGNGGAIYNYASKTVFKKGLIQNNNAKNGGVAYLNGAFLVRPRSYFEMSGGRVIGNTAAAGSSLFLNSYASFTMSGGQITGNTATNVGGVLVSPWDNVVELSGNSKITGNTSTNKKPGDNLYLDGNSDGDGLLADLKIGRFTEGADVNLYVKMQDEIVNSSENPVAKPVEAEGSITQEQLAFIKYEDPKYGLKVDGSNAILTRMYTITTEATIGGTVSADRTSGASGDPITVTVIPDTGYKVISVTYSYKSDNTPMTNELKSAPYTFNMPDADVTVNVTFALEQGEVTTIVDKPEVQTQIGSEIDGIGEEQLNDTNVTLSSEALNGIVNEKQHTVEEAKEALQGENVDVENDQEVYIHIVTEINVRVESYNPEGAFVLDITPKYKVVASTEKDPSNVIIGKNAAALKESTEFDITESSTIVIPIPEDFADEGEFIRVAHDHNGKLSYYNVPVKDGKITFVDKNGFSTFTLAKVDTVGLDDLTVTPGTLDPAFNPDGQKYGVSVGNSVTSVTLTAEAHENCTVTASVNGEPVDVDNNGTINVDDLPVGDTVVKITVTHEGKTTEYIVTITRAAYTSGDSVTSGTTVKTESTTNGSFTVSDRYAGAGKTVTVTPKPNQGYVVDQVIVTDRNGGNVTVKDNGDGTYSFEMVDKADQPVTVKVTFKEEEQVHVCPSEKYTDVNTEAWYHEGVDFAIENGLMVGKADGIFDPDGITTRAEMVTILYRLEGEPAVTKDVKFNDVPAGQWFSDAINWAAASGVVDGYGYGKFGPNDTITREQMAAILYRYASLKGYNVSSLADLSEYTDAGSISGWANTAMRWAVSAGIIEGTSTATLAPAGNSTRAMVAVILMRFCKDIVK